MKWTPADTNSPEQPLSSAGDLKPPAGLHARSVLGKELHVFGFSELQDEAHSRFAFPMWLAETAIMQRSLLDQA